MVLQEPYNGEGNWTNWSEHFESMAAVNRGQDAEELWWLLVRLVGRAATAFRRVPGVAQRNNADCMSVLMECFDPHSKCELYLAESMGCKKCQGEDWATLAKDMNHWSAELILSCRKMLESNWCGPTT